MFDSLVNIWKGRLDSPYLSLGSSKFWWFIIRTTSRKQWETMDKRFSLTGHSSLCSVQCFRANFVRATPIRAPPWRVNGQTGGRPLNLWTSCDFACCHLRRRLAASLAGPPSTTNLALCYSFTRCLYVYTCTWCPKNQCQAGNGR